MATLILGTVGRALGGSLGGIVGSLLGGAVDRSIFGSGAQRQGPRTANLTVQSAAYGEPLPRVYGRMRVAGNLVWTAGIKESQHRAGSAKHGTATNTYSYSSSFAVVLAGRPILRVERIWADGKLLRAADGTLNFPAIIRVYGGGEGQPTDPLIAAAEGSALAPGYRGRATVVFEDLPLADYGNRIPNLTFEVVADVGAVALDQIAVDLGSGLLATTGGFPAVTGFAAAQAGTIRQALTALGTLADLALHDDGTVLRIGPGAAITAIAEADAGAADKAKAAAELTSTRGGDAAVPDAVWLAYSDPDRDYQAGIQAATRRTPAVRVEQHDVPVVARASDIKTFAAGALRRAVAARTTAKLTVPWRYAAVAPGDLVLAGDDPVPWRVTQRTVTGATISYDLDRTAGTAPPAAIGDSGRSYIADDAPQGATLLHVLDLPALPGMLPTVPRVLLAAAGMTASWRRADVLASRDGGESYAVAASINAAATVGTALGALAPGTTLRWDRRSTLDVELVSDTGAMQSASEAAVLAGANLAAVGDELIQFAVATPLGPRRFRISTLLRGRRGSERAVNGHAAGDRVVLLDDRVVALDLQAETLGATLLLKAAGPGEDAAALTAQTVIARGVGLRPLSPATISVVRLATGDRTITWQRRSRGGFAWSDGTDAPLAEDSERYRVTILAGDTIVRSADVTAATWTYAATDYAADAATAGTGLRLAVAQVSAVVGPGDPTSVPLT